MKHTTEPWEVSHLWNIEAQGKIIATAPIPKSGNYRKMENAKANIDRIVACVNACQGINPKAVPKLMEALREISLENAGGLRKTDNPYLQQLNRICDIADKAIAEAERRK